MAKDTTKTTKAADKPAEDNQEEFAPPAEPSLPSKDGRKHRATYAKKRDENKNPMPGYNLRIVGPAAHQMSRRWVPVTKIDNSESMEFTMERLWAGKDDDTGENIALYSMWKKPRKIEDEIPF